MELAQVVAAAIVGAVVVAFVVLLVLRCRFLGRVAAGPLQEKLQKLESEVSLALEAKVEAERRLAVAEEKASRIPELENALRTASGLAERLREQKQATEDEHAATRASLAARTEALARAEAASQDLQGRLNAAEESNRLVQGKLAEERETRAALDQSLASRTESLVRTDAANAELRTRIERLESAASGATDRFHELTGAKAKVDEDLATKAEALRRVEGSLEELRERLHAVCVEKDELAGRLGALGEEKATLESEAAKTGAILFAKTGTIDQLREELQQTRALAEQLRSEAAVRVDALTDEKGTREAALAEKEAHLQEKTILVGSLQRERDNALAALDGARKDMADLRAGSAILQETLSQERKQSDEKLALLGDARKEMSEAFKTLADEVMLRHGETFSKTNKEQIDVMLLPLREQLSAFQQGLQNAHTETGKDRAALAQQIKSLVEASATMNRETHNLTLALRGKVQTQGAWGEMILATILERSGLRKGEEYEAQQSHAGDDGTRLRPDVIVKLPNSHHLVIDSKVSLKAFEQYVKADSDAVRATQLADHVASLRHHIKALSVKEYQQLPSSTLDYVIMFVPIEGALAAAFDADPDLSGYAIDRNIAIATPTTLMIALRTVANVWNFERRNKNAEEIAERAGRLYDKFVGFAEDMVELGERLAKANEVYAGAFGKLSTGKGNLVSQVEKLKALGARTAKALPDDLADAPEGELPFLAASPQLPTGGTAGEEKASDTDVAGTDRITATLQQQESAA